MIFNKVQARADERNIPFAQAARELGLEFTEDDLKSMAAEAGLDLAVSLTPVGPLKKAWDVLGNLDDIIALTQLYGELSGQPGDPENGRNCYNSGRFGGIWGVRLWPGRADRRGGQRNRLGVCRQRG